MTIAKRPSVWDGMAGVLKLIWVSEEAQYFCKRGWTAEIDLPVGQSRELEFNVSVWIDVICQWPTSADEAAY